jgi:DNA replication protein DnaC
MKIHPTRKLLEAGLLPVPPPTQDVDGLSKRLAALDWDFAAAGLPEILTQAAKEAWGPPAFLDALIRMELERREERRLRYALNISGLPPGQTLAGFDFAFQPAVERSRIETLATCGWLREKSTLLIQGPSGVGKTHLATALGIKAIECGFSVCFYRLDDLLAETKKHTGLSTEQLKHKKYMAVGLLIIDEMGFQAMSREEANRFFRLVNYRYGRGSTCITTNKSIKDWPELLAGDEALAMAILDRLLHSSIVLNIRGRSYRLRDLEESLRLQKPPSQPDPHPVTVAAEHPA